MDSKLNGGATESYFDSHFPSALGAEVSFFGSAFIFNSGKCGPIERVEP